jgi:hypothetical protein
LDRFTRTTSQAVPKAPSAASAKDTAHGLVVILVLVVFVVGLSFMLNHSNKQECSGLQERYRTMESAAARGGYIETPGMMDLEDQMFEKGFTSRHR